jgi:tRNA 2-thiocytidine biosynthesis protein TtcA
MATPKEIPREDKQEMKGIKRKNYSKLSLHLNKWLEKASWDYGMIEKGDRVLVGVSGGMDSLALLDLMEDPKIHVPSNYSVLAVNIDLGFDPEYRDFAVLERFLRETGRDYIMEKTDIGPLAHSEYNKKNPCFLCSRLRRKRLFEIAGEKGCNKIALAHHKDDIIETLLINMFYGREISTMAPKQSIFKGAMHIIRPFAYIREPLIKRYGREAGYPAIENKCPTSKTSRRLYVKNLLNTMEKENRLVRENIFRAMKRVKRDYLL